MNTHRRTVMAAAALAGLVAVAGCGSSSASSAGAGGSGTVTVNVVAWKGGGTEIADLPELNTAFEAQHPGIKVAFKYVASADYATYNDPRLAAGDAADVLMLDKPTMEKWQSQGYLADLSGQPWVSTMDPSLKSFNSIGGKTYQFTQENIGVGLYVNLDLLKQAGITSAPGDWPTFLADLQALKAHGENGLMIGNVGGWGGDNFLQGLAANLVYPTQPTWSQQYDQGKVHFASDWSRPVAQLEQMLQSGTVDGKLMQGVDSWSAGLTQFKAGKWAFLVQGAWELSDFTANAEFDFQLVPIPGNAAGQPATAMTFVGTGLGVNSQSKNTSAAEQYVDFMSQPANAAKYLQAEGAFSTLTGAASPVPTQAAPMLAAFQAGHYVESPMESLGFTNAETQLQTAAQQIFQNPSVDPAGVLAGLDKAIPPTP